MPLILDFNRHEAVARDHLPRVADYDDGSRQVLYWDGVVRSMETDAWIAQRGALPLDPTQVQIDAAMATQDQAAQQAQADAAQLRQQIVTLAQSAVGVRVDALTAAQVRALFAIVLWQEGALDKSGVVQPLTNWIDRRGTP